MLCLAHATLLLVKAAAVAVTAPDDLWPAQPPHPPGGAAGGRVVVGLVYMYTSIGEEGRMGVSSSGSSGDRSDGSGGSGGSRRR